jgi:hypothetical protein
MSRNKGGFGPREAERRYVMAKRCGRGWLSRVLLPPVTVALSAAAVVACDPPYEAVEETFVAAVEEASGCGVDAECVVVYPGCPLGCYVAVHRDDEASIKSLADALVGEFRRRGGNCSYDCVGHEPPRCIKGRCVAMRSKEE